MSDLMQKLAMSNAKALMRETDSPRRMDSSPQSIHFLLTIYSLPH